MITATCRIFGFAGLRTPPGALPILTPDNLLWPCISRDMLELAQGGEAQSTKPDLTPAGCKLLLVQIPGHARHAIHFEISAGDEVRDADFSSPIMQSPTLILQVDHGWTLSFLAR